MLVFGLILVGYGQLAVSHGKIFCSNKLGMNFTYPGKSCRHIYNNNRVSHGWSGYYWIKTDKVQEVHCDVELSCGGIRGSWMRIAKDDTTQGDDYPDGWKNITSPALLCRVSLDGPGCYSVYFSNNNIDYISICGKVLGYQSTSADTLAAYNLLDNTIDSPYLDGISITHVWSYAAGVI